MQGSDALVLGGILVGFLLIVIAIMVFQESRSRFEEHPPEYIIEEAVRFVHARLDSEPRRGLGLGGVRRILEWQVFFLQQLAKADKEIPIVMGITEGTIDYISERLVKHGHPASREEIIAVLEAQDAYLIHIGAVGEESDEVFE